jgi:hypothetical protein
MARIQALENFHSAWLQSRDVLEVISMAAFAGKADNPIWPRRVG